MSTIGIGNVGCSLPPLVVSMAGHVNHDRAGQDQYVISKLNALPSTKKRSVPASSLIVESSPQQNSFCFIT
jgi:hypothetical protein